MLRYGAVTSQALSERADACLAGLDDAGRDTARRMFLQLVSFDGDRADTPRRQPLSALRDAGDPARVADVLRQLTDARLLRVDGDQGSGAALVDVADGGLIAAWPTLQGWIRTHGRTEQLRRQLEADAGQWRQRTGQGVVDAGLLDRGQLSELAAWLTPETRRVIGVSEVAESFIAASRAAARRRWWPGRTSIGSALAILLILMILATPVTLLSICGLTAALIHRFQ